VYGRATAAATPRDPGKETTLARTRRSITLALGLAMAALPISVVGTPASAAPAAPTRLRPDPGPRPLYVFGDGVEVPDGTRPRIPTRGSTTNTGSPSSSAAPIATTDGSGTPAAPASAVPAAPIVGAHFDALARNRPVWPADPIGAMGQDFVVTAVNTRVAVYDPASPSPPAFGPVSLASTGAIAFPPGTQIFDPKVVFDEYADTFVLVFLALNESRQRSWVNAVTIPDATADDQSTWCGTVFRGDPIGGNGPQWADYPGLGFDSNSVAIETNAFSFEQRRGFAYAQIFYVRNSELFAPCGAGPVNFKVFARANTRDPDGSKAFTIQPAQTVGAGNGDQYLLSYDESGSKLVVWRLRETPDGPRLSNRAIPVPRAQIAPYGTQRGGSYANDDTWWDPGDLRLVNAFYDADRHRLYAAHTIFHNLRPDPITGGYPEAAIRWYEVHPTRRLPASKLTRRGIIGAPEADSGWPVIATDAAGDVFVTFSRASRPKNEYLSAWAAEIKPGRTRARLALLTAGQARFEALAGVERWGDFNGINRDPIDGSMIAMVNQYAQSDGSGATNVWQQTFDLVHDG